MSERRNLQVIIVLNQYSHSPYRSLVVIGDEVSKGQLIAEPQGLGANAHSSV